MNAPASRPTTNGASAAQQHRQDGSSSTGGAMSQSNLNNIVIEYLNKKGYTKTEAVLRAESANQDADGRPNIARSDDNSGVKYRQSFELLRRWIEDNLDIYKADLRRFLWPIFVYSFLNMISDNHAREGQLFFMTYQALFDPEHLDDLRPLKAISLPEHVESNETAKIYRSSRYRLRLSSVAFYNLIRFLESKSKEGGAILVGVIQTHLNVMTIERDSDGPNTLAMVLNRASLTEDFPAEDEGIPGHNPGSANTSRTAGDNVLTKLKLGPGPREEDLDDDVRLALADLDAKEPPSQGQPSFEKHFEQIIKQEDRDEAPTRTELQLPSSTARDVAMEVQRIREDRDRFRIESRTGGAGPAISVCMFTFHNSQDNINCIEFSDDNMLVAVGTSESYIRSWRLDGKAMPSMVAAQEPMASRRLIGHSGPVYALSFSPSSTANDSSGTNTSSQYLLSASEDSTIRLWSVDVWTCLVIYKGHSHPVWDITWGPFGHYFVTGSYDKTARLFRTDRPADLRVFAGHDKDVDCVAFHPNGAYVFSGSSDRTVRMWAVTNGYPVRMFTGHSGNVTTLACSPSGRLLASADDSGTIILWDLASGRLRKRMRGHARGGIWSIAWSVESTVLVSGGADGTVRVWDIDPPEPVKDGDGPTVTGTSAENTVAGKVETTSTVASTTTTSKKKSKDVVVTPDQLSAFPTKKSPVYKVRFTRQNLVIAGGAYLP